MCDNRVFKTYMKMSHCHSRHELFLHNLIPVCRYTFIKGVVHLIIKLYFLETKYTPHPFFVTHCLKMTYYKLWHNSYDSKYFMSHMCGPFSPLYQCTSYFQIPPQCYSWGGAMGHRPIQQKNGPLTTEIAKWKMAHTMVCPAITLLPNLVYYYNPVFLRTVLECRTCPTFPLDPIYFLE